MSALNPQQKKWTKRIGRWLWIFFAIVVLIAPLYIFTVSIDLFGLFGGMPSSAVLENPENELASELYTIDNELLGKYYRENRSQVTYDQISQPMVNTLIATEDERFYQHSGIDLQGLMRVVIKSIILGQREQGGGSTITQQLAKQLFKTRDYDGILSRNGIFRTLIAKTKESILAVQLERNFTKEEIIAMYLNTVDFGSNTSGIKVAAKTFFDTTPDSINYEQAAVFLGMINKPTRFNPVRNPELALAKRNSIIQNKLVDNGLINEETADSLSQTPIDLSRYKRESHNEGVATYFREHVRLYLNNWCEENGYDLYEDGLKIYTTIDSKLQTYAETAVAEEMAKVQEKFYEHWEGRNPWVNEKYQEKRGYIESEIKKSERYRTLRNKFGAGHDSIDILLNTPVPMTVFSWNGDVDTVMSPMDSVRYFKHILQTGFMAMNPYNGHILAWVGGIDHRYFQYDHVYQSQHQPGSTFKPFVYATAIENGYSPCYKLRDVPVTFQVPGRDETWTPENAEGEYSGEELTIRQGLAQSKNSITAGMMKKLGIESVIKTAHAVGIQSDLAQVWSLCLGTSPVSVYEMVGAYSTFVNSGTWNQPMFISRIEDKYGNVIQKFTKESVSALNEEDAFLMLHMLRGTSEERGGTALGLSPELRHEMEIAAKTGTTQSHSDGWFMGATADLVAGGWVGGDDTSIRWRSLALGQGARTAMPIWQNFMLQVYNDENLGYKQGPFRRPKQRISVNLDCSLYERQDVNGDSTQIAPVDSTLIFDDPSYLDYQ